MPLALKRKDRKAQEKGGREENRKMATAVGGRKRQERKEEVEKLRGKIGMCRLRKGEKRTGEKS